MVDKWQDTTLETNVKARESKKLHWITQCNSDLLKVLVEPLLSELGSSTSFPKLPQLFLTHDID